MQRSGRRVAEGTEIRSEMEGKIRTYGKTKELKDRASRTGEKSNGRNKQWIY